MFLFFFKLWQLVGMVWLSNTLTLSQNMVYCCLCQHTPPIHMHLSSAAYLHSGSLVSMQLWITPVRHSYKAGLILSLACMKHIMQALLASENLSINVSSTDSLQAWIQTMPRTKRNLLTYSKHTRNSLNENAMGKKRSYRCQWMMSF